MTTSNFRNWHKSLTNSKKKELSTVFPVYVSGSSDKICVKFEQPMGMRIEFELSKEDSKLFLDQVSRIK